MKTVLARITGTPGVGDIIMIGYRPPKGGDTSARYDAVEGDTAASVVTMLQSAIGKTWLGDDAFQVRQKEPSTLVIMCTDRVTDVKFYGAVKKAEGSDGDIEVTIEEI